MRRNALAPWRTPSRSSRTISSSHTRSAWCNRGAYEGIDFTDRLGELQLPVFIVHGNADRTVPIAYGRDLAAGIAHAEFHEIEGAGHGITGHAEAQRLLREWIARVA
ncbi:MAG: alpha/beta fold hydrolase [Dehalococcoidia bacterium]